ncbi:MAG TPA: hypothetical protein VN495_00220, partial [Candidatus Paceibacterota bacterium]|nr:hypothetical protein [Candidatus Paceibacterota bacterium]
MKHHSLFQIILLCVFGAIAVAGVLVFSLAIGGGGSGASIGKVVIWGTLDKTAFDAVLQEVFQANPDMQGVSYVQKDAATYQSQLADALAQ